MSACVINLPVKPYENEAEEVLLAREQRNLAAIVAADVAGYSRLMDRDESTTVARVAAFATCRTIASRWSANVGERGTSHWKVLQCRSRNSDRR